MAPGVLGEPRRRRVGWRPRVQAGVLAVAGTRRRGGDARRVHREAALTGPPEGARRHEAAADLDSPQDVLDYNAKRRSAKRWRPELLRQEQAGRRTLAGFRGGWLSHGKDDPEYHRLMPDLLLTDGGLETSLTFTQGLDLPEFAAFPLLETEDGRRALRAYWKPFLSIATECGVGFAVDTATWRANADWGRALGYDADALAQANRAAASFARQLASEVEDAIVNGVVGPRGDGYVVDAVMTAEEAAEYHTPQIAALVEGGVDQVSAITMTYADEAIGFVRAARDVGVPAVVSFTVETDGRLPSGQGLRDAIESVDDAAGGAAEFFMVNCAHPTHFAHVLDDDGPWLRRIGGIRANASTMSHEDLDAADELDAGDPADLAMRYLALRERLPELRLLGGCCGTDHPHVRAIGETWQAQPH